MTDSVKNFISQNHNAVVTTFRRSGAAQLSIVTVGAYGGGAAFTTTEDRAKLANLRRDPRCSLLVSADNWRSYLVLEGRARIRAADNTDADTLRDVLRAVYVAAAGKQHPDWEEYDQAMRDERRAAVIVVPERVYGTAL